MRKIRALAPAKVNLTFDIIGSLPDGYHQVETLMQSVDLQDDLSLALEDSDRFSVSITCTNEIKPKNFPLDDSNLMVKAARRFFEKAGISDKYKLSIDIEKSIPIGAGLAGGSADAAAVLVGLNHLFDKPLNEASLSELGAALGADVPFCIQGGTSIGTARGDKLQPVKTKLGLSYCIVKPRALSVATAWAYGRYDAYRDPIARPSLQAAVKAMETDDLQTAIKSFGNVFEPVIFKEHPDLQPIKQQMLKIGCWCCHLSGSGPALFAVVADREQAHAIRKKLLKTDDLEFDYVRLSMPDLGPPLEFYIAQSTAGGVTLVSS
jgi:4-diphosphocytidyl-2-C-methyl-D-erythritol kinase